MTEPDTHSVFRKPFVVQKLGPGLYRVPKELSSPVAIARQAAHPYSDDPRYYRDPNAEHKMGLTCELAFAAFSKLEPDWKIRPHGDGGSDFQFTLRGVTFSIDVKGAQTPHYLFLKAHATHQAADLFVLCQVEGEDNETVRILGWEHKVIMLAMPVRCFGPRNVRNHYRDASKLRPIEQLEELLFQARNCSST